MSAEAKRPTTQTYLIAGAVLLALPVTSYVIGYVNAPKPMDLTRERQSVDREGMKGTVLLDALPDSVIQPMAANLEDKLEILGMSVDKPRAAPGTRIEFTFYYRAKTNIDEDWQIFGHIDGINNVYRIHADHFPAAGHYTTELWQPGEIIADHYSKYIPLDAPPGRYDVWIGFYIGDTRLKLLNPKDVPSDNSNRVKVGQFEVGI